MSITPSMAQVYIFSAEHGLVKIGYTTNPKQRLKKLQTSSGFKIKQQQISPLCYNYMKVEKISIGNLPPTAVKGSGLRLIFK